MMFFKFAISELRWPVAAKFCTVISIYADFIMQVQNWGPSPKKLGAKHAKFYTTSDFDHPKSERQLIDTDSPPTFGETSPVNFGPLSRKFDMCIWTHLKRLFGRLYFGPYGMLATEMLHTLDTGQGLLAHTTNRVGGPHKNFKGEHLKLGLKFHICAPITLGVVGVTSRNFTTGRGS